jgi:nitrite reductase/ring-hydroxylating ferredoxin subunit
MTPEQGLVPLARVAEIPPEGLVVSYRDGPFEESAILLVVGDHVQAWRNRCRHLAMRLDARHHGQLFDRHGRLVCQEHGASYLAEDGRCVGGPCEGASLRPLPIVVVDGQILLDRSETRAKP